jgi:hypothetical protein
VCRLLRLFFGLRPERRGVFEQLTRDMVRPFLLSTESEHTANDCDLSLTLASTFLMHLHNFVASSSSALVFRCEGDSDVSFMS